MSYILVSTTLAAATPPHHIVSIATCALNPLDYTVEWLHAVLAEAVPEAEGQRLTAWLRECAGAERLVYYDDRAADFAQAIRRVTERQLPVAFRTTRDARQCCRGDPALVVLEDLTQLLGERQYELVPTIFRAVEPLLCLPDAWRICWQRGNQAAQTYFALAHAAASACLYLHTLLNLGRLTTGVADEAVADVLRRLEQQSTTATATLDVSDLPK